MGSAGVRSAFPASRAHRVYEGPVQDLIDELGKMPGVGPKSAQRIAFHLLGVEPPEVERLIKALQRVRDGVQFCTMCGTVSDKELCRICADPRRDRSIIDRRAAGQHQC